MKDNEQERNPKDGSSPLVAIVEAKEEEEIVFVRGEPNTFTSESEYEDLESGLEVREDEEKPIEASSTKEYHNIVNAMKRDSLRDENALKFPADCYSLMSLNEPSSAYFWYGFMVFVVQMSFIILILLSMFLNGHKTKMVDDNPDETIFGEFIATEADILVRISQALSLAVTLVFVDASMLDLVTAIHTFPNLHLATKKDKIECFVFSCSLRFVQGLSAICVAFLLVISSSKVIDIILNFTALNFISNLDNVAFEFAASGRYGREIQDEVHRIIGLELPVCMYRRNKSDRYFRTVLAFFFLLFGSFTAMACLQDYHASWDTPILKVDIFEDGLQDYSGCYTKIEGEKTNGRNFYSNGDATFGFCYAEKQWYLYKGDETKSDPCDQEIILYSIDVDTFDISTSFYEDWFTMMGKPADVNFFNGKEVKITNMCRD